MGIGVWERRQQGKENLLIAIPHTGLTLFEWAVGFKILQPPVPFNIISNKGLPIDRARCDLVAQAKGHGASHIFFMDSDIIMPPDGLIRLWNHRMPIVTGIYGSKHEAPGVWVEQAKSGLARYAAVTAEHLQKYPIFTHKDIVTGGGCCLIDMQVFNRLEEPYFEWTQGRVPNGVSEDFYFFEKCRNAGIPVHVDTTVRCIHGDFSAITWDGKRQRLHI
jgi:glycosyltransferase involved in cell wall biosynthesis